ncbi:ATP-binding protein [Bradyrhizobium lablabi]|uniref:GAF domain-containing sensor histidine kinase n=1 Tax=Bradyrhizobium lablabi TaxID=722472 RepID=UPI001BA6C533|nr:ATP-binding protein [Bradyrhizobium lablabi]MBR0697365.1 GAF domain-containing protein [Bradyrhizobium lablabi]
MILDKNTTEIESISRALQGISKEISFEGLAKALLKASLNHSGASRGAVLLSEEGELLAKADASFPREKARFFASEPPVGDFQLSAEISEKVLTRQEIVVRQDISARSAMIDTAERSFDGHVVQLCVPLIHQERTIGVLYLESDGDQERFTSGCISVLSMLASQAAISFESAQLIEALRETNLWMIKGQQIGRMGSYRWNTRTQLTRASRECYRIFDIDRDVNPVPFDVFTSRVHADDIAGVLRALMQAVRTKSPFHHEYRVVQRDRTTVNVVAVGRFAISPTGDMEMDGIVTDVTERKAAERALLDARNELARAVRLASVGELAGSIIHEINQPLTGIITSAEACVRWLSRSPEGLAEASRSVSRVIEQVHRASDIVAGLRTLVREAQFRLTDVQINEAIEEIFVLLKRDLEQSAVALRSKLDQTLPMVKADKVQIQQVLLNLVRNAIEAMNSVDGRARILTVSSIEAGDHVCVRISDTGVGFDEDGKRRLFDALYTTKAGGLGLGLSICRKIITVHGGQLWVEDSPAHGATFAFTLPLRPNRLAAS